MSQRSNALAARLELGANVLAKFAKSLTDVEWRIRVPKDGRTIGVIIHHVAKIYPIQIQWAQVVANGDAVEGITSDTVDEMNAEHANHFAGVTKDETLALLERNSAVAAAAIRALDDSDLDQAARVSLYGNTPLTCQFLLEDHAVRQSYHHLAILRAAFRPVVRAA
jgi:DinB family protein